MPGMADRLRWWVIPGALLVLARIVTLEPRAAADGAAGDGEPDSAMVVQIQDASGSRHMAVLPVAAEKALFVQCPAHFAGQRIELVIWRRIDGEREATAWLRAQPNVRHDHVVPMAGLPAGRYDVEVRLRDEHLQANDVAVPGTALPAPIE